MHKFSQIFEKEITKVIARVSGINWPQLSVANVQPYLAGSLAIILGYL
jgi:hypothetical protein